MPFDEYLQKYIFEPLNMDDTGFWVPDSAQHRLSMIYTLDYNTAKLNTLPFWVEEVKKPVTLFSGGGGLVSTIEDYSRFAQMLLNYGILDRNRILKESTTKLILSNQLPEGIEYLENEGYGLGGSVDLETGVYGWSGMASTYFWVYPDEDLAILCFTQFIPPEKYPFAYQFKDKVLASIKK
jgi:CubicO group peptidase (beta-lactamase class C family)